MMNRASHHQCLKELRLEYLKTSSKKGRDRLLDEYDTAKTSYQRVMESKDIAENKKAGIKKDLRFFKSCSIKERHRE